MEFLIDISDLALTDSEEYFLFIRDVQKEPDAANKWFRALVQPIYSLEKSPSRCPLISEHEDFGFQIRHLIYFSHGIVFRIDRDENKVVVYRVYHGARRAFSPIDLG